MTATANPRHEPDNDRAEPGRVVRTVTDHRDDADRWCRWSRVNLASTYPGHRCPAGCTASGIEHRPADDHEY